MNSHIVVAILFGMVHSGVAFAPERGVVHDILDSAAFNVAMFAMGWVATRYSMKFNEQLLRLQWIKALTVAPLALIPHSPTSKSRGGQSGTCCKASEPAAFASECTPTPTSEMPVDVLLETPLLAPENGESHVEMLLAGLSSILISRINTTIAPDLPPWRKGCFHSRESEEMSLSDYMAHIHWFFECSSPCLILALIYLDRALSRGSKITLNAETCHRLFLTSLLVALKFHDDDWAPYTNAFYADIGNVRTEELNCMERQFCNLIDWQFFVGPEEYIRYNDLITAAATISSA
jgi:hypothetical protein